MCVNGIGLVCGVGVAARERELCTDEVSRASTENASYDDCMDEGVGGTAKTDAGEYVCNGVV